MFGDGDGLHSGFAKPRFGVTLINIDKPSDGKGVYPVSHFDIYRYQTRFE